MSDACSSCLAAARRPASCRVRRLAPAACQGPCLKRTHTYTTPRQFVETRYSGYSSSTMMHVQSVQQTHTQTAGTFNVCRHFVDDGSDASVVEERFLCTFFLASTAAAWQRTTTNITTTTNDNLNITSHLLLRTLLKYTTSCMHNKQTQIPFLKERLKNTVHQSDAFNVLYLLNTLTTTLHHTITHRDTPILCTSISPGFAVLGARSDPALQFRAALVEGPASTCDDALLTRLNDCASPPSFNEPALFVRLLSAEPCLTTHQSHITIKTTSQTADSCLSVYQHVSRTSPSEHHKPRRSMRCEHNTYLTTVSASVCLCSSEEFPLFLSRDALSPFMSKETTDVSHVL